MKKVCQKRENFAIIIWNTKWAPFIRQMVWFDEQRSGGLSTSGMKTALRFEFSSFFYGFIVNPNCGNILSDTMWNESIGSGWNCMQSGKGEGLPKTHNRELRFRLLRIHITQNFLHSITFNLLSIQKQTIKFMCITLSLQVFCLLLFYFQGRPLAFLAISIWVTANGFRTAYPPESPSFFSILTLCWENVRRAEECRCRSNRREILRTFKALHCCFWAAALYFFFLFFIIIISSSFLFHVVLGHYIGFGWSRGKRRSTGRRWIFQQSVGRTDKRVLHTNWL